MNISISLDARNPGQFFACCGLLELADRLWSKAEGWFENENTSFVVDSPNICGGFAGLIEKLSRTGLEGELSPQLAQERTQLEEKRRQAKKKDIPLAKHEELRRKELGRLLREGMIVIGEPFNLRLDWWQGEENDNPKTWAGSQQVLRIAQAALQDTVRAFKTDEPFDFRCVMRPVSEPDEGSRAKSKKENKTEPFYFDSRHGANALPLDIGFSPNELRMESKAFPAVELLCLIGLQRCRPRLTATMSIFEYFPWSTPLPISVAPAAVCGFLGQGSGYRFENAYRTDQRKHKGYLTATVIRSNQ
jgi:CRISPR-associated protein Csb3